MVIPDLNITAFWGRNETRLLLEHLGEIHQQHRVAFDQLLKFPNCRMKRGRLLLGRFASLGEPGIQSFPVGWEPVSDTAASFVVVCRVVHVSGLSSVSVSAPFAASAGCRVVTWLFIVPLCCASETNDDALMTAASKTGETSLIESPGTMPVVAC